MTGFAAHDPNAENSGKFKAIYNTTSHSSEKPYYRKKRANKINFYSNFWFFRILNIKVFRKIKKSCLSKKLYVLVKKETCKR